MPLGTRINMIKKQPEMENMPMDLEVEELSMQVEEEEGALTKDLLPGRFTSTAINTLTKTLQKFFSALGIQDFEALKNVSEDAMSSDIAGAIMAAVEMLKSAVDAEVLEEDMSLSLEELNDDRSLAMLAGRLQRVIKNRKLLKELKAYLDSAEEPSEAPEMEMTEEPVDSDKLFAERM